MHAAMEDFTKDGPKYLKDVKIVVFQRDMVTQFEEGIKGKASTSMSVQLTGQFKPN